jgi:hypothetical protein
MRKNGEYLPVDAKSKPVGVLLRQPASIELTRLRQLHRDLIRGQKGVGKIKAMAEIFKSIAGLRGKDFGLDEDEDDLDEIEGLVDAPVA